MNLKSLYKPTAVLIAILMFFSSTGFSMDVHFCGGKIESFSFFGVADACDMMQVARQEKKDSIPCCAAPEEEIKSCPNEAILDGNCCQNKNIVLDNLEEFEISNPFIGHYQQIFVTAILWFTDFDLNEISKEQINYAHYNPPLLEQDFSILNQVFRI